MTDTTQRTSLPAGWNPYAALCCMRCGARFPLDPLPQGCPSCASATEGRAPVEVVYDGAASGRTRARGSVLATGEAAPNAAEIAAIVDWLWLHRQPIAAGARIRLGRPHTPLVPVEKLGPGLYVKNETVNPTWGHKDRLHEVTVGVARLLGSRGILATTTGNHGAAAAAHASLAGLPAVIFCHARASAAVLSMITAYGGVVAQLEPGQTRTAVARLVDTGWFPATSMDPAITGRANAYGAEGYKEISYEILADLGRMPTAVIVPTASGDTLYGVAKGFAELSEVAALPMPMIVAGQPATADALARSFRAGRVVEIPDATSVALSVADPLSGRQALTAVRRWNGDVVSVSEDEIRAAARDHARAGLLVESASAVSLAVYRRLQASGRLGDRDETVLLATSSGVKWPAELDDFYPPRPARDVAALENAIGAALDTAHEAAGNPTPG